MTTFKLPDLGEGLQDAEIIEWQVEEGEDVAVDQVILVVETAKAIVELPSPVKGRIGKLCAKAGDTVEVGQVLVEYEGEFANASTNPRSDESVSVVGVLEDASAGDSAATIQREEFVVGSSPAKFPKQKDLNRGKYGISPDLLAFAAKLGVDDELGEVDAGNLSKATIADLFEQKQARVANVESLSANGDSPVIPLKGTKKIMAQTMMKSHQHVPAVTLFDDAYIGHWEAQDITVRVIEAMVSGCQAVPLLNAWFDEESMSIQTFEDINVGVAVNSDEGLFVPVLREAQSLKPGMVRTLIDKMIKDVNKRSIKPQKLMGATISLSNFGTLSGRYATPIIVPPQVAIVGVGVIRQEPIVRNGKVEVENVMPLSLSFDHRAATGAEAAKFLSVMIQCLQA